ncbi:hypothetical protein TURU_160190 [Turdus rufiventris]|nr:hypothetical protein TURU_160190 [Turdus rufiventris]
MAGLAAEADPSLGRDLVAELRGRDGRTRTVRVPYPAAQEDEAAQLRGLREALSELQERVVELLAPLVEEERAAAGGARRAVRHIRAGSRAVAFEENKETQGGEVPVDLKVNKAAVWLRDLLLRHGYIAFSYIEASSSEDVLHIVVNRSGRFFWFCRVAKI